MAEDKAQLPAAKSSSDTHIPPPADPYVTYQSPYPRKPSDEVQNPFIEFRRLADSTFSSIFSNLPRLLGTEKFKEANIRESGQEFVKAFDQQAKEFENKIAEMVRVRTEQAEGFRKKLEQEWEERRRDNEQRMEEESQRWDMMRRGLEKCPGLRPDGMHAKQEAQTELDLYDGLKAYSSPAYTPVAGSAEVTAKQCPWKDQEIDKKCPWKQEEKQRKGWLSDLGFDGRRRAKNIPLYTPYARSTEQQQANNADWQEYDDQEMDPFTQDDHVVPWLRLSPYSPLALINEQTWANTSNQKASALRHALSEMPWDEAFEDLMSVHKTGNLPSLVRRLVYWGGPNQWMTDMAVRGSLGPKWTEGFMVASLMGAVDGNRWKGFDGLKEQCMQIAGREFRESDSRSSIPEQAHDDEDYDQDEGNEDNGDDIEDWINLIKEAFDPRAWEAYEQMQDLAQAIFGERRPPEKSYGAHAMSWPSPEEVLSALAEGRRESGEVENMVSRSEEKDLSSPTQGSWSSVKTSSWSSTNKGSPESLVSTFTTTTERTLPDGSVETKRVLKKRFADGREENSESTEVKPVQLNTTSDSSTQTLFEEGPSQLEKSKSNTKGGWFWN